MFSQKEKFLVWFIIIRTSRFWIIFNGYQSILKLLKSTYKMYLLNFSIDTNFYRLLFCFLGL